MTEAATISWTAAPLLTDATLVQFFVTTPTDERMLSCSDVQTIQCADFDFQAALTSIGTVANGLATLTSTLRFTATVALNGTWVECSAETATGTQMENQPLIVEGM